MIKATPSWRYFAFGGQKEESIKFGSFTDNIRVLDIDNMIWNIIETEEKIGDESYLPSETESSSMVYHADTGRLIVFGGSTSQCGRHIHTLDVSSIVGSSDVDRKQRVEEALNKLEGGYKHVEFEANQYKDTDMYLLKMKGDDMQQLDEDIISVDSMFNSRSLATFEDRLHYWKESLSSVSEVYDTLSCVQMQWLYLENYFSESSEIKKKLPNESEQFAEIDHEIKNILVDGKRIINVLDFCNQENIKSKLEKVKRSLDICQKGLGELLDRVRKAFPRFYLVSNDDLLEILSSGNDPRKVMTYIPMISSAINTLFLEEDGDKLTATGIESCIGKEEVKFDSPLNLAGEVENYFSDVLEKVKSTLKAIGGKSNKDILNMERKEWLVQDPSQITLLVSLIDFVHRVEQSIQNNDLEKCREKQKEILYSLVELVRGNIEKHVRNKVMSMITIDTHSFDIVESLVAQGVKSSDEFQWQCHLRPYWTEEMNDFNFRITDAKFEYGFEYLGNGSRLVITPLTDRIYITATQSLHLGMGCAPCGPAGSGKTETIKDLANALGKACYVFNCSDQMDYLMMGKIFKGLASSGSWGCFDEFNRVVPEVLSV